MLVHLSTIKRLIKAIVVRLPFGDHLLAVLRKAYRSVFRGTKCAGEAGPAPASLACVLRESGVEQALFHSFLRLLFERKLWTAPVSDAEQVQTLIEAHDFLAEDVINRDGDIPTALTIYRRKRQWQRRFAEAFGLDRIAVLYLPDDWVRNIGHIALLDFWLKMKHLGWRSWGQMILLASPRATANAAYLNCFRKHLTIVTDPHLIRALTPLARALGNRVAGLLELPTGREEYFCEGMGVIQEAWEAQRRGPLLELSLEARAHGWETLRRLGMPEGSWFVCLHVRAPGYHKEGDDEQQAHRNADIHSYLPAVRHIIAQGGWVVRLGDSTMPALPSMPGLIDYAHCALRSPALDVFLCAACRFFIGVASGLSHVPTTFGVPCALTNWVTNPFPVASGQDRFLFKLLWSETEKRFLDFRETLVPRVRRLGYSGVRMRERGLRAVDNTPEEILELVQEMLEVCDGTAASDAWDEQLQARFRELAVDSGMIGFGRVGRAFLRRRARLLPEAVVPHQVA
jgi:putative glycosyltransferase (TIGR04372 family)